MSWVNTFYVKGQWFTPKVNIGATQGVKGWNPVQVWGGKWVFRHDILWLRPQ